MAGTPYGMARRLPGVSFEEAIQKVTEALQAEGFGVLTEIDVQATFRRKLDVDHRPYRILGACNPQLAHRALALDPALGLLLPCNVVVEMDDEGVQVSVMDPAVMSRVSPAEGLEEVAQEARQRLERMLRSLGRTR